MANDAPNHPLRDALAGLHVPAAVPGEAAEPVEVVTGVVSSVDLVTVPHTVRVRIADGTVTGPLPFLAWWVPRVNDVTWMLRQGAALYPLGAIAPAKVTTAPHRHDVSDIDGTILVAAPTPPTPPAAPGAPPALRTVGLAPVDMAYWSSWGWKADDLIQGGPNNRAFWFYGGQVAAAKGAGTIVGGSVYIERSASSHGVGGAANVRLGTHGHGLRPGSGAGALGTVEVAAHLNRGQAANVPLTAAQIAALNAGSAGVGLEPGGSSYTSADYLRATAGGASGQLSLTIQT